MKVRHVVTIEIDAPDDAEAAWELGWRQANLLLDRISGMAGSLTIPTMDVEIETRRYRAGVPVGPGFALIGVRP